MYKLQSLLSVAVAFTLAGTNVTAVNAQSEKQATSEATSRILLPVSALTEAQKLDKLLLVTLPANGCAKCDDLNRNVFDDKLLGTYLKKKYVVLQQNISDHQQAAELARVNKVETYPSTLVFTANGKLLGRVDKFEGVWDYVAGIDEILAASKI